MRRKSLGSILLVFVFLTVFVNACAPASTPAPTAIPALTESSSGSPLKGRLLFSRFTEDTHTFTGMFISKPDGSGETTVPMPWTEGGGTWSKSGKEIAVPTLLEDGRVGTAIIAADGSILRVLSISDTTLNLPCTNWSPDDTRLACTGWDESDSSRNGIYAVDASDGGNLQRLTTQPAGKTDFPGDYSPDGMQFIFKRASGDEGPGPLMLVDANGGEPRLFYDGQMEGAGQFAPNGLSVVSSTNGVLVVINMDGTVLHQIARDGFFLFGATWSPDGTRLVFSADTGTYHAELYTSLPDGTDLQQVTHTDTNEITVDWGP
ncbi:MAG: hypothetical protein ABI904_10840 [Chloroflexota bacterium]